MEKAQLNELENGQMQKMDSIFDDLVFKVQNNEKIEIIDFYPEIKPLLKNKTYTNYLAHQRPIFLQLPFYDSTILELIPLKDETSFKKAIGITVSQTLELYKKGKVIPLLQYPPLDFEGLDYLDPLLELDLPVCNIREPAFDQIVAVHLRGEDSEQIGTWFHEGMELFRKISNNKMTNLPPSFTNLISKNAQFDTDLLVNIGYSYAQLKIMGYHDLTKKIFSITDPHTLSVCLWTYNNVLVAGARRALGGVISWDAIDAVAAKNLGMESVKAYPVDVGKLLIKEFKLASIEDFGFEKTIQLTNQTTKARRALFDLDSAVMNSQQDSLIDRSNALERTWRETNEIVTSMRNTKDKIAKYLPASVGVVGELLSSSSLPGIIASLVGAYGIGLVSDQISEILVKIRRPNHVVSIFDLRELQIGK